MLLTVEIRNQTLSGRHQHRSTRESFPEGFDDLIYHGLPPSFAVGIIQSGHE